MLRRLSLLLLIILIWTSAWAVMPVFFASVSASQTNTATNITMANTDNKAYAVTLINDGPSTVYFDLTGVAATTSSPSLKTGESLTFTSARGQYPITRVDLICAAAQTATVRVYAVPAQ